jgi:hypothetical protein
MGNILSIFNEMYPEGALEKMSFQELSDLRKSIHDQEDEMVNNISSHSPVITTGCLLDFSDVNMSILAQMITMKGKEIKKQMDEKNISKRKYQLNPVTIIGKVECEFSLPNANLLTTKTIYNVQTSFSPTVFCERREFLERKVFEHMQFLDKDKVTEVAELGGTRFPMLFQFDLQECLTHAEEGYDWPINAGLVFLMEE